MNHAQAAVQKLRVLTYEKFGRSSGILPKYNGTDKKIPQLDLITYETSLWLSPSVHEKDTAYFFKPISNREARARQ